MPNNEYDKHSAVEKCPFHRMNQVLVVTKNHFLLSCSIIKISFKVNKTKWVHFILTCLYCEQWGIGVHSCPQK